MVDSSAAPAPPPLATADSNDVPASPASSGLRQRRPSLLASEKKKERESDQIKAVLAMAPPNVAIALNSAAPYLRTFLDISKQVLDVVGPAYIALGKLCVMLYNTLPFDLFQALLGLALCFFGGAYCSSIAAVEAFNLAGWSTTRAALEELWEDALLIKEANEADEKKDEDGDGRPDAQQLTPTELVQRKVHLALLAVRDPQKLATAVGGVYAGWLAVIGTLRLEFAKTVTLGVTIAEMVEQPAMRFGLPLLAHLVPEVYHRWLPVWVRTATKAIAVAFAWYLQVVISAFHSAMRGGLLCSRGILRWANKHGLIDLHEDDTYLDEVVGYGLAAAGFAFQFFNGFALPFPLNTILFPLTCVEW